MDKQTTLSTLDAEFKRLLKAVQGLDAAAMTRVFYGSWSVKDIVAHISGWHHTMTAAMERMARGEKPTPEGVDYTNADEWNAKFAAAMAPQNSSTVVADLQQSFANYRRAAAALPDDRYGEGKTINRLIEASGIGHYQEHIEAIEGVASKPAAA